MFSKKSLSFTFLVMALICCQKNFAATDHVDFLGVLIPKQMVLKQSHDKVNLQGYSANLISGEPVYVGAFFTSKPEKKSSMLLLSDTPMAMVCYIIQDDLTAERFKMIFTEEMLVNNPGWDNETFNKNRLIEFQSIFTGTFNAGDIIAFEYASDGELTITVNGDIAKSWTNGRSLFNAILKTWIGPYPPTRNFKDAILGN